MIAMRSHFAQRILVGFFVVAALAIPAKSASASDPNYEPHNTAAIVYYLSQPNGWETYHALNTTAYLSQQFIAPELRVQITKIGTRLVRIGRKVREEAEKRNDGEATFQLMLGDKEKYLQLVKAEAAAFTNAESPISIRDIFDAIARAFCQVELETMSFELHQARAARRAESHGDAAASSSADPLFASSATAPFKVSVGALRSLIGGAESLQGFEPVARAVLQEGTAYRAPSRPDVQLLLEVNPDYAKLPLVNELLKPYERDNPPEDAVAQNAIEALASIQIVLPDYESRVIRKPPANDAQRDSEGEQTKVDRYRANQKVRNQSYDVLATYLFVWGEVFNSRSEARKAAELVALTKEFHLMYDGIEAFTLLGDAGKIDLTSAMLMQANTAIFAAKFASVFLSASHPSDLEIILEAMEKMRSQMHERFDRVEDILFALDEKFETRFQEIHKALRLGLSLQVAAISKIDEVNTRISELRREVLERLQLARVRAALKARDDVVRKVVKVRYDNVVTPSLFGHVADPGQVEAAVGDILEFIETELAHKDAIDIAVNTALLDDSVQLSEQVAAMLQQGAMPSVDNTLRLGQALAAGRKIEAQGGQPQDVELGANERVPDGDLAIAAADVLVELYIRHYDDPLPIKPLEAAIKSHEKVLAGLRRGRSLTPRLLDKQLMLFDECVKATKDTYYAFHEAKLLGLPLDYEVLQTYRFPADQSFPEFDPPPSLTFGPDAVVAPKEVVNLMPSWLRVWLTLRHNVSGPPIKVSFSSRFEWTGHKEMTFKEGGQVFREVYAYPLVNFYATVESTSWHKPDKAESRTFLIGQAAYFEKISKMATRPFFPVSDSRRRGPFDTTKTDPVLGYKGTSPDFDMLPEEHMPFIFRTQTWNSTLQQVDLTKYSVLVAKAADCLESRPLAKPDELNLTRAIYNDLFEIDLRFRSNLCRLARRQSLEDEWLLPSDDNSRAAKATHLQEKLWLLEARAQFIRYYIATFLPDIERIATIEAHERLGIRPMLKKRERNVDNDDDNDDEGTPWWSGDLTPDKQKWINMVGGSGLYVTVHNGGDAKAYRGAEAARVCLERSYERVKSYNELVETGLAKMPMVALPEELENRADKGPATPKLQTPMSRHVENMQAILDQMRQSLIEKRQVESFINSLN